MSSLSMPLLIINLGGEMVYILEQRLRAQNIIEDKSIKVLNEIVNSLLNKQFLHKIFMPQSVVSRKIMRTLFEHIAHSSIMRLNNSSSMDKLYDLMTMAVKYQVTAVTHPYELLNVTMNHLDTMKDLIEYDEPLLQCIDDAHKMVAIIIKIIQLTKTIFQITQLYYQLPEWKMALIRDTMLLFFQDAKIKVSILMNNDYQDEDGDLVFEFNNTVQLPPFSSKPGTVRYFTDGECSKVVSFPLPSKYSTDDITHEEYNKRLEKEPTDRGTHLGKNLYAAMNEPPMQYEQQHQDGRSDEGQTRNELDFLTKLLGSADAIPAMNTSEFTLTLFEDNEIVEPASSKKKNTKEKKEVTSYKTKRTASIDKEMTKLGIRPPSRKGKGRDLASMMDEATADDKSTPKSSSVKKRSESAVRPPRKGSAKRKISK